MPVRFVSADEPTLRGTDWIAQQWERRGWPSMTGRRRAGAGRNPEDPRLVGDGEAPLG
jgi:hypothetical protein